MRMIRRVLLAASLSAGAARAQAQAAFPSQPLRVIVPFAPGGAPDITARILAPTFGEALGQPVVVENRSGANGLIGSQAVATARPDGHTLLAVSSSFAINPAIFRTLPFDPRRDFAPVGCIVMSPGYLLVVAATSPITTVAQLIEAARQRTLFYGSPGIGNSNHLATAQFAQAAGVEMEHVPYRGGAEAVTALLSGQVQLLMSAPASVLPMIQSGQLRAIGFAGDAPFAQLPQVPLVSATLPGFRPVGAWHGLFAPAATPSPAIDTLNAALRRTLRMPAVKEAMAREGYDTPEMSPPEFRAFVERELDGSRAAAQAARIEPQ